MCIKSEAVFYTALCQTKKPDLCPIKINDYFCSCHLKNLADGAINLQ